MPSTEATCATVIAGGAAVWLGASLWVATTEWIGSRWSGDDDETEVVPEDPRGGSPQDFDRSSPGVLVITESPLRVKHMGPGCDAARIVVTAYDDRPPGMALLPLRFRTLDNHCTRAHFGRVEAASHTSFAWDMWNSRYKIAVEFTSTEAMNDWIPFDDCRPLEASWVNWPWAIDFLSPAMRPGAGAGVAPDRVLFCPSDLEPGRFLYYWIDRRLVVAVLVTQFYPEVALVHDRDNAWLWEQGLDRHRPCWHGPPAGATRPCVPDERDEPDEWESEP